MAGYRCAKCGTDLDEADSACPHCGTAREGNADATAAFVPVETEEGVVLAPVAGGIGPALVVQKGPDAGERFALSADVVTIGRDPASDIFLNDITVSRRHARIERGAGGFTLSDSGSLNGTYVNRDRIESRPLARGDEIQIGKFRLIFTE